MINGPKFFDRPAKNNLIIYDSIQKVATGQGDGCITGCLMDYNKMIAIDLSKQQAVDDDPKAIQKINFTENLPREQGAKLFFFIEEAKETRFFKRYCKSILNLFFALI